MTKKKDKKVWRENFFSSLILIAKNIHMYLPQSLVSVVTFK